MKKVLKSRIFVAIITAIVCITGTAYAATQILASNIAYKETTVDKALDDLYTKAKPEYTGSTTIIPSFNEQIFSTKDKIMTKNLKVEAIPSTYKNLTTTTTAIANTILSGYKAYTSDGTLVTGNVSTDCVSGTYHHTAHSQWNISIGFIPSKYMLTFDTGGGLNSVLYDSIEDKIYIVKYYNNTTNEWNWLSINNNAIKSNFQTTGNVYDNEYDISYMACR